MADVQIRKTLHEYVGMANDKKIEAIYTILKDSIPNDYSYSPDELETIVRRREKYKNDEEQLLSVEELIEYVRQNKL